MSRILRTVVSLTGAGAFVLACASPTLPLPPPEVPNVETNGLPAGEVTLVSSAPALPLAIIISYNDNPNLADDKRVAGTQADQNGNWEIPVVYASPGDTLQITQQEGEQQSSPVSVQVQ
jgi:hypothetical protein